MSTAERTRPKKTLPALVAGEHLDQPTFHERYAAMPPETRAELVDGVVYMPSPLSFDHGEEDNNVSGWLFHYKLFTRGVHSPNNATVKLDAQGEPQPDCQLFIPAELGGQVRIDEQGYITGARRADRGDRPCQPPVRPEREEGRLRTRGGARVCRRGAGSRSDSLVHPTGRSLRGVIGRARRDLPLGGLSGTVARRQGPLRRGSHPADPGPGSGTGHAGARGVRGEPGRGPTPAPRAPPDPSGITPARPRGAGSP